MRLPLRWTAIMRDHVSADLALSGGVHEPTDAVQAIMVGATVVCVCSMLYQRHDVNPVAEIVEGLRQGEEIVTTATFLIDAESNLQSALKTFIEQEQPE